MALTMRMLNTPRRMPIATGVIGSGRLHRLAASVRPATNPAGESSD